MSWLMTQPRLCQVYVYTTARLNAVGIRPDGAVIKQWLLEDLEKLTPIPDKFEVEMVLVMMVTEGVQFHGDPDSAERFAAEPLFSGSYLGIIGSQLGID